MTKHPQQEQITNTEWIIDLEKFDNRIEKYVSKDTFCTFSSTDLKDTLDEIRTIVYNCIERRERSRTHTPAEPATDKFCDYQDTCARTTSSDCTYCDEAYSNKWKEHNATIRKAEREQVLDVLEEFLNSDDHLSIFKWEVREQIRSLRGGGAT